MTGQQGAECCDRLQIGRATGSGSGMARRSETTECRGDRGAEDERVRTDSKTAASIGVPSNIGAGCAPLGAVDEGD